MHLDLRPFIVLEALLVGIVIALIVRRKMVARHEDDTLHLAASGPGVSEQVSVAHKLEVIDRWGKLLTVVAVVFGLMVGGAYVYQVWVQSTQIPGL